MGEPAHTAPLRRTRHRTAPLRRPRQALAPPDPRRPAAPPPARVATPPRPAAPPPGARPRRIAFQVRGAPDPPRSVPGTHQPSATRPLRARHPSGSSTAPRCPAQARALVVHRREREPQAQVREARRRVPAALRSPPAQRKVSWQAGGVAPRSPAARAATKRIPRRRGSNCRGRAAAPPRARQLLHPSGGC
jgi:hypothetical protein